MLDGIKGFFEKFSFTDEDALDDRKPLTIRRPLIFCFKKVERYIKDKGYESLIVREDYNEIYFKRNECEITLLFLEDSEGKTLLSSHVSSEKINHSRKELKEIMKEMKGIFGE